MKLFLVIAIGLCGLFGSGCTTAQAVPKGMVRVNPRTGMIEISQPKDTELKNATFSFIETNGFKVFQVSIGSLSTKNNPDVIEKSALGTAAMINAGADAGVRYFTLGLQAAQAAGVLPKLPSAPIPATNSPPQ